MITPFLLIILYTFILSFFIKRHLRLAQVELPANSIYILFLIKICAGILYGIIHQDYFYGGDTFLYFEDSQLIYNTFLDYPDYYIFSLLGFEPMVPNELVFEYPPKPIFWKDFGTYALIHANAIFHIFSFGYYSVHIVFIAFASLLASINFYQTFRTSLRIPKNILIFICFLLPSVLFWTSGLHKDVVVYYGLSLFLWGLHRQSKYTTPYWSAIGSLIIGGLLIGGARYYLLALLLPPLFAHFLSTSNRNVSAFRHYLLTYASFFCMVFFIDLFLLGSEIPYALAARQSEFLQEMGGSNLNIVPFEASWAGLLLFVPEAILNIGFQPFLWNCTDYWQLLAALEITGFWILCLLVLCFPNPRSKPNAMSCFLLFYAISNFLLIGLLVGNVGTIVRYRAISLGFLTIVLAHHLNFTQLKLFIKNWHPSPSKAKKQTNKKQYLNTFPE